MIQFVFAVVAFCKRPVSRWVASVAVAVVQFLVYARVLHGLGADGRGWLFFLFAVALLSFLAMFRKVLA